MTMDEVEGVLLDLIAYQHKRVFAAARRLNGRVTEDDILNPHDIQKIEVLKNPADVGLYGIRGGNGVIRITTKTPGGP